MSEYPIYNQQNSTCRAVREPPVPPTESVLGVKWIANSLNPISTQTGWNLRPVLKNLVLTGLSLRYGYDAM